MWLFKQIHLMLGLTHVLHTPKIRAGGDYWASPAGDLFHLEREMQTATDKTDQNVQ